MVHRHWSDRHLYDGQSSDGQLSDETEGRQLSVGLMSVYLIYTSKVDIIGTSLYTYMGDYLGSSTSS